MSIEIGMKGRAETLVAPDNTAQAAGSGLLPVFATPWMAALMENAAVQAVQGALSPEEGTVGTRLDVTHDAATPVGMKVWAEAEVTAVEGRKLTFSVSAFDEAGSPTFSYFRERWIRNSPQYRWVGPVHEVIPPRGRVLYSDVALCHKKRRAGDPDRNLRIYEKLLSEGKPLEPRHQYYYSRELYYHRRYEEAASGLERFLSQEDGWLENKIEACSLCADCYLRLGREEAGLNTLLRSMSFDMPRAEL